MDDELERIRMNKLKKLMSKFSGVSESKKKAEVVSLNQSNFESFVMNENAVVDFYADWCGPCKMISPVIAELAYEYAGRVVFGKLNVDENEQIAASFAISAIPALMFFKKGKAVDVLVGAYPKSEIKAWIERNL